MVESFALYFDGSKELIGKEEVQVDETLKVEVVELPKTGEKWIKTTIIKDVELRSYLNPEHKDVVWKKSIPSTWLEEKWQQLLKEILVYITCEGKYNRVMMYHFKLMNHFIGINTLNLPFYLHKSLTKMAHQVKAQPTKIARPLYDHGMI